MRCNGESRGAERVLRERERENMPQGLKPFFHFQFRDPRLKPWGTSEAKAQARATADPLRG
jgi:hypothetical protein